MSQSDISTLGVQVAKATDVFIVGYKTNQQAILKTNYDTGKGHSHTD